MAYLPPASPLMRHASPGIPIAAQTGQIQPGSITYTTSVGPDGSVTYHPFRAVPASYQTAQGLVHGIQWVPAEATSVLPAGATPASEEILASFSRPGGGGRGSAGYDWRDDGRRTDDPYRRGYDREREDYVRRGEYGPDERDRDHHDRDYRRDRDDRDYDREYRPRDEYRRDRDRYEREDEMRSKDRRDRDYDRKYGSSTAELERRFQELDVDRDRRDPYDSRDYRDRDVGVRPRRNSNYGDRPPASGQTGYASVPYGSSNYTSPRSDAAGLRRPVSPYREAPIAPRPVSPYQAGAIPRAASPYQAGAVPRPVSPYQAGASRPTSAYGPIAPRPTSAYGNPAPVVPRAASPYRTGGVLPPRPVSPYHTAGAIPRPVSPYHGAVPRPVSPYQAGATRPTSAYGGRQGISRTASPGPGYATGPGGSPVTYTSKGYEAAPTYEDERMLAAPEGFSRPPNLAQSYTPFDIIKIQDMDDFFENIPRMPLVLVTHDVYHEDWIRLMMDLSKAWSGKLPVPQYDSDGRPPRRTTLTADLIDLWNASFFNRRGAELVFYKGRERRSGRNAGTVDLHLPGFDDYDDDDDYDDELSEDSEYDNDRYKYGAYGGTYGRGVDREMAEMHEARRQRHERRKLDQKRRRHERRHRQKARDLERKYALYLTCVSAYGTA